MQNLTAFHNVQDELHATPPVTTSSLLGLTKVNTIITFGLMEQRRMMRREEEFQEMHIRWVWSELQERFGFNIPEWKKKYAQERAKQAHTEELHFFFTFMHKHVNPVLNRILCRPEGYDTFNKFTRFVVRQGRK